MKRNLILTTAHRISFAALEPFLRSLKQAEFTGDLVIFCSGVDDESIRQMQIFGAQVERFHFAGTHVHNRAARLWALWKKVFASGISQRAKERIAHLVFHLFYRRHLLYLDFLRARGGSYEKVLLTDCRDVFFQTDPFDWPQTPGLHLFLEEATNKLGTCLHHIRWITSQFGTEKLEQWKEETVSCAGTVFGDVPAITAYLQQMVAQTMKARSLRAADGDQGIHNYLLLARQFRESTVHENRRGPVMTLGPVDSSSLKFDARGRVLDETGTIVPVLHQYDRHSQLQATILSQLDPISARKAAS